MKLPFIRRRKRATRVVVMERRQWLLGGLATVLVAAVWWAGGLQFIERLTFDWRTRWFWRFSEPPSANIAIVAMDDASITSVGRWPWPRSYLAAIIDELRFAEVQVAALDLLLDDPEKPLLVERPDPANWEFSDTPRDPSSPPPRNIVSVDGDRLFADAILAHGNIVLAASFKFGERAAEEAASDTLSREQQFQLPLERMFAFLQSDPALMEVDLADPDAERAAVKRVMHALIGREYDRGPEYDAIERKFRAARTLLRAADRASIPSPALERDWARSFEPSAPIPSLANSAALLANVSFDSYDADGLTRRVPVLVRHRDRLWPTLGMAAVLAYWGADSQSLTLDGGDLVVRLRGSERRVQLSRAALQRRPVDGLVPIPWPRGTLGKDRAIALAAQRDPARTSLPSEHAAAPTAPASAIPAPAASDAGDDDDSAVSGWEFQFFDLVSNRPAEVRAGRLFEPTQQAQRLKENLISLSQNFEIAYAREVLTDDRRDAFRATLRALLDADVEVDSPVWQGHLNALRSLAGLAALQGTEQLEFIIAPGSPELPPALRDRKPTSFSPAEIDAALTALGEDLSTPDGQRTQGLCLALAQAPRAFDAIWTEIDLAEKTIREVRADLKQRLRGKIVFFGWTATGQTADFVATSIHPRTPGVHVHAAIANMVLQDFQRRAWPTWAEAAMLSFLGFLGTWIGVRSGVLTAPVAVVAVLLSWFAFNGILLWDLNRVDASFAGPAVACAGGWLAVLLHRLLVEQRDRKVTEERFKSYVSPAVVDILVNNPDLSTMKPSMRDMTVMFSDVADFTTTSERLGPELLAKCLSKYLKEMTEILQKNRGTLDKYLGDGIMCFWNAPLDDNQHARHACQTAVQMIGRLEELNDSGAFEEAGRLKVRIGLCTGPCMVGDFGNPPRNSNYTLLGDTANFAARLEGANKFFGTRILGTQAVRDQAGPDIRWRRIGKVFVKGKKEADTLYELIGPLNPHGPATDDWIDLSDSAVDDYANNRFDDCLKKFGVLSRRFGDEKLADLYAETIAAWRARPDYPAAFDGSIVLTEK